MIFVLAPGRCGTKYLTKMLELVPGVTARHEPRPDFASVAREAQHDLEAARRFWDVQKLPAIAGVDADVYFETSHLFAHGFADTLLDLEIPADVVGLSRPHREVALSLWRRRSVPARSQRGLDYLLHPEGQHNRFGLNDWTDCTDYQLCYWHAREIEARTDELIPRFMVAGNRTYRTSTQALVEGAGFRGILNAFDLLGPAPNEYRTRRGWIVNGNPPHYNTLHPEEIEEQERALCERISEQESLSWLEADNAMDRLSKVMEV